MGYVITIIIAIEVITGALSAFPPKVRYYREVNNKTNNVLGVESDQTDATPTPEEQPTQTPDNPTPDNQDNNPVTPDTSQTITSETTVETPLDQQNSALQPQGQYSSSEGLNSNVQFLDSMAFSASSTSNPAETLDPKTVEATMHEDQQLAAAKSPEDQANLLVQFETKNLQTINSNFSTNQFDDLQFNTERLSRQIDKTIEAIQDLPVDKSKLFRDKMSEVCKSAEYMLRPGELVVPEAVEQTMLITRGKCFNFQQ